MLNNSVTFSSFHRGSDKYRFPVPSQMIRMWQGTGFYCTFIMFLEIPVCQMLKPRKMRVTKNCPLAHTVVDARIK